MRDFLDPNAGLVEVGWWRQNWPPLRTYFFVEVRRPNGDLLGGPWFFDLGLPDQVGLYYRFKVSKVDFTTTWRFYVDDNLDGSSPIELCPFFPTCGVDAAFQNGYPMGETARRGNVSAADRHINLWSRNNLGQWAAWTGQAKEIDEIVGYHWHKVSGNEYVIHTPEAQH